MQFAMTSDAAWERAAACAKKAEDSFDDQARVLFELLRDRWIAIAKRWEWEDLQREGPPAIEHLSD